MHRIYHVEELTILAKSIGTSCGSFVAIGTPLASTLKPLHLRLLTVLGGSAGLAYLFRYRTRLRVRIVQELPIPPTLSFEAENLGASPMSLNPTVTLTGWVLSNNLKIVFEVKEQDRSLPSHVPRRFKAGSTASTAEHVMLWYRTYHFSPTKGRTRRLRLRYIDGPKLSLLRFMLELAIFRLPASRLRELLFRWACR